MNATPITTVQKTLLASWDGEIIKEEKVLAAFKAFKVKKPPGTDGIPISVLQQLPEVTLTYIKDLYKLCVLLGYTPIRWKECKIDRLYSKTR